MRLYTHILKVCRVKGHNVIIARAGAKPGDKATGYQGIDTSCLALYCQIQPAITELPW